MIRGLHVCLHSLRSTPTSHRSFGHALHPHSSPFVQHVSPPYLCFHSTFIPRYLPFVLAFLPCLCDKGRNWRVRRSTRRVRQSMCNKSARAPLADPYGHLMMDKWTSWVTWWSLLGPQADRSFLSHPRYACRLLKSGQGVWGQFLTPGLPRVKWKRNCREVDDNKGRTS